MRLKEIYAGMDSAYEKVADRYGFSCKGCPDNCCTQRFYHHTLAEYFYLFEGIKQADDELVGKILTRARIVTDTYIKEVEIGGILNIMCPVNFNGLCSLYTWRPMICRMHGLPHSFVRPDGELMIAEGCARFNETVLSTGDAANDRVDRTPFYRELAGLEKELRTELGFKGRYKKTTAEMLMDMAAAMTGGEG